MKPGDDVGFSEARPGTTTVATKGLRQHPAKLTTVALHEQEDIIHARYLPAANDRPAPRDVC